jgi:hypothetical protein
MKRHALSVVTVVISLIVLIYSLVSWPSLERLILAEMKAGARTGVAWDYERGLHAKKSTRENASYAQGADPPRLTVSRAWNEHTGVHPENGLKNDQ